MASPSDGILDFLSRLCGVIGFGALALITLADNGATRMYAWPWWGAWWVVQIAPIASLALRAWARPLALPSPAWRWTTLVGAAWIFLAAAFSPFRAESFWYAALPLAAIANLFLLYDWLQSDRIRNEAAFMNGAAWCSLALIGVSFGDLCIDLLPALGKRDFFQILGDYRNIHPLGHPNYTAGLGLITLPWLIAKVRHSVGKPQLLWAATALLALAVIFTSASRGGFIGLLALALIGLRFVGRRRNRQTVIVAAACGLAILLGVAHPRARAMFNRGDPKAPPNISNVQRSAMLKAGLRMTEDRPLLGWGPGTTPLIFPRYRHELDGGVETALQLHNTPMEIAAELGLVGLLGATLLLTLAAKDGLPRTISEKDEKSPTEAKAYSSCAAAAAVLGSYLVFSLTDYQFDVPFFALAVAACAALLAAPSSTPSTPTQGRTFSLGIATLAFAAVALGHRDPTPSLNEKALEAARQPEKMEEAVRVFNQSLRINPDQEIAHFNLAWLLLESDAAAAEQHFLAAARLVPDKGNVYLGLGLARAKLGHSESAAHAFAMECLNDPLFMTSPWWSVPEIATYRAPTAKYLANFFARLSAKLPSDRWPGSEARYVTALFNWLWFSAPGEGVVPSTTTEERRVYFAKHPSPPDFSTTGVKRYRRERPGYPVVMRNLDLVTPVDLFEVNEMLLAADTLKFLFPQKGWLPAPLLVTLLDEPLPPKN